MKNKLSVSTWAQGFGFALMLSVNGSAFGQGIIYVTPDPQPTYSMSGTPFDVDIDINGDGAADFILRTQDSDTSINNAVLIPLGDNEIVTGGSYSSYLANMNVGGIIGSSLNPVYQWSNTKATIGTLAILLDQQSSENGNFTHQTNGYIGFDVVDNGTNYYGWMDVSSPDQDGLAGDAGIYGTIKEWAYESSPNTPITIPVPEPAASILISLSALAFYALRRRK